MGSLISQPLPGCVWGSVWYLRCSLPPHCQAIWGGFRSAPQLLTASHPSGLGVHLPPPNIWGAQLPPCPSSLGVHRISLPWGVHPPQASSLGVHPLPHTPSVSGFIFPQRSGLGVQFIARGLWGSLLPPHQFGGSPSLTISRVCAPHSPGELHGDLLRAGAGFAEPQKPGGAAGAGAPPDGPLRPGPVSLGRHLLRGHC